jgi:hypothetical protein
MALWTGFIALIIALIAYLGEPDLYAVLRSMVELSAVVGVFTLICAAEASN